MATPEMRRKAVAAAIRGGAVAPETYRIAFSVERRRPGCVLVQAALAGTVPNELFHDLFPAETWISGIGGDMKGYETTREQLDQLSAMARQATKEDPR